MKPFYTLVTIGLSIAVTSSAEAAPSVSILGSLVRSNSHGDSRYANMTTFSHNGTRGYVAEFTRMLGDPTRYREVMLQGITSWEAEARPQGFTNDLASSLAYYTLVNVAIAKGENYKFYLLPNLVSQFRKALSSKVVGKMSSMKKQDYYDYMLAQSVYLQTATASNPSMSAEETARWRNVATVNVENAFGMSAARMEITESGLSFN